MHITFRKLATNSKLKKENYYDNDRKINFTKYDNSEIKY